MPTSYSGGGQQGSNLEQVIIEVIWEEPAGRTSIAVAVVFYVQCAYSTSDDQVLTISGSGIGAGSPIGFRAVQGRVQVARIELGQQGMSYGGGPAYAWRGSVSGHYGGATPWHEVGWTLPARPASVPNAPGVGVDSITASSARCVVMAPANNGATIDAYEAFVQRARDAVKIKAWNGGTGSVSGLERATGYQFFARAHNAVGWSAYQGIGFNTLATVPGAPTGVSVSDVTTTTAKVSWVAPADNGGSAITSYGVQVAENAAFTEGVRPLVGGNGAAPPATLTDLVPGRTYYARVRAGNAMGAGGWSSTVVFTALSGAKMKVGDAWVPIRVWLKVAGTWRAVTVHQKVDGVWRR
jgi:hypothetical protein